MGKIPQLMGESFFLFFLFFFSLSLVAGIFIFYQYGISAFKTQPELIKKPIQFQEAQYREILEVLDGREKKFKEAGLKEYPDLFRGSKVD